MADDKTKGLFDGLINAVSSRDEKAALEAAKKALEEARAQADQELAKRQQAEANLASALAQVEQETATRQRAEARTQEAEANLASALAQVEQETATRQRAEARAQEAEAKVTELQAELASVKQQLEQAKVRTYVVQSGDSLSQIAKQLYGDAKRWPEIFEANKDKIKDPNMIHPGQELRIP